MPETKRPLKVFLCHASADKPKVRELYRYLRRRGIKPWFDEMDLMGGQDWQTEIPKALTASDAIIICLTKNSGDKEGYIQKEIKFALDKALEMPEGRIFVIPVRFEECEVPFTLRRYQWIDLFDEAGYTRMMRALKFRAAHLERTTVELATQEKDEMGAVQSDVSGMALSKAFNSFKSSPLRARPFLGIGALTGIIFFLLWLGSQAGPRFFSPAATEEATTTLRSPATVTLTSPPGLATETVTPALTFTETPTSELSPLASTSEVSTQTLVASPIISRKIFDNGTWQIELKTLSSDVPNMDKNMDIKLNGLNVGAASYVSFGHWNGQSLSWSDIATIHYSGHVGLTPYDLPFGTGFILGPVYRTNTGAYFDIRILRIDIYTVDTANGTEPIRMTLHARDYSDGFWPNYHLELVYNVTLPDPENSSTQMKVQANYSVVNPVSRSGGIAGFQLLLFSSMYVDNFYHDSDGIEYMDVEGNILTSDFSKADCDAFTFDSPQALSTNEPRVELRHTDDQGWQGNTPNAFVVVNSQYVAEEVIVPQGYIRCEANPSYDNVTVWLNQETAPLRFNQGDTDTIEYTLVVQDDPVP